MLYSGIIGSTLTALSFALVVGRPPNDPVRVTLSSPTPDYVLGQPVLLNVTAENTSRATMMACELDVYRCEPEIRVLMSSYSEGF